MSACLAKRSKKEKIAVFNIREKNSETDAHFRQDWSCYGYVWYVAIVIVWYVSLVMYGILPQ